MGGIWGIPQGYPLASTGSCRCTHTHTNMNEYTHVHVYICKDIRQGGRHMTEDNAVTKCRTWVNEHTVGLLYTSQCKSVEKHRKRFAVLGSSLSKELSPSQCWHPLGHTYVLDAPLSLIFGQYFKNLPEARQIRQGGEWGIKTSSCLLFIFSQVGLWCFPILPPEKSRNMSGTPSVHTPHSPDPNKHFLEAPSRPRSVL